MVTTDSDAPVVTRVMVATDRSRTATRAVRWASSLAAASAAELLLVQVVPPDTTQEEVDAGTADLVTFAHELADSRGRAKIVRGDDPAQALIDTAALEGADVLVVGNVGMAGRKEFLLGNIPNRISHKARCTVVIVNTAADGQQTATQAKPSHNGKSSDEELFARAMRIGRILTRTGLREILTLRHGRDESAMRAAAVAFREALDDLGPTFAKLGQILSTRPDLIPPEFVEELATLQERVTPLTEAEVVAAMEKELGVPWEDVFDSIDPTPLAAGTIAQVHRATLETGEPVVVKVQRPTAEADILKDLALMEMFGERAAARPGLRRVFDVPAMIEHLSQSLRRELDFRGEAGNMIRMKEVLKPFPRLDVPAVYEDISTKRLLVMQFIPGTSIYEAPPGEARKEAAQQLFESFCHQVMVEGFFHADPHPGNLKWWNDTIYFLDLGMVGELDARMREMVLLMILAFAQRDATFLAEVVLMISSTGTWSAAMDHAGFRQAMDRMIVQYRDLPLEEIQFGPLLEEVTRIAAGFDLRVPAALMLSAKALAQVQLATAHLDPDLDPFGVAERFMVRGTLRRVMGAIDPQRVYYDAQKAKFQLFRLFEAVEGIAGMRPGSHLQVDFRGTERLEQTIGKASKRMAIALSLSSTILGAAMVIRGAEQQGKAQAAQGAVRWLTDRLHRGT